MFDQFHVLVSSSLGILKLLVLICRVDIKSISGKQVAGCKIALLYIQRKVADPIILVQLVDNETLSSVRTSKTATFSSHFMFYE